MKTLRQQLIELKLDRQAEIDELFSSAEPLDWDDVSDAEILDSLGRFAEYIRNHEYKPVDYSEYYRLWHREIYGE